MKSPSALLVIVAAALATAVGYFAYRDVDATKTAGAQRQLPQESVAATKTEGSNSYVANATSSPGKISTAMYDSVSSYTDLQQAVSKSSIDAGQRAEYLRTASVFCENVASQQESKIAKRRSPTQSDIAYQKFASNFCKGFSGSSDAHYAEVLAHPESDVAVAQLLLGDDPSATKPETKEIADRIVRNSKQPSALLAAAGALVAGSPGSWDLGKDLATSAAQMDNLPNAQWLAVRMLACDYSGGCGPNGFYTMIECVNYQACRPGVSITDVWRDNTAQPVYRLASAIHAELVNPNPTM